MQIINTNTGISKKYVDDQVSAEAANRSSADSTLQSNIEKKADKNHASTTTDYGVSSASNYGHAMASSTIPKVAGTASVGSETAKFARGDHVHPAQESVTGNAGTATALKTARTIAISGGATGTATEFDGTEDITIPVTSIDGSKVSGAVPKATADADGNTFSTTYAKKSDLASVYIVRGSATGTALSQLKSTGSLEQKVGYVYNCSAAYGTTFVEGANYVITAVADDGTLTWDKLSETVDLSDYQKTITAGTGLSFSGTTLNHSNSVTANTSGVGSTTAVPIIKYDAQGHITSTSTATIYPPTTAGTNGQYWKSDGSGQGVWQTSGSVTSTDSTLVSGSTVYNFGVSIKPLTINVNLNSSNQTITWSTLTQGSDGYQYGTISFASTSSLAKWLTTGLTPAGNTTQVPNFDDMVMVVTSPESMGSYSFINYQEYMAQYGFKVYDFTYEEDVYTLAVVLTENSIPTTDVYIGLSFMNYL